MLIMWSNCLSVMFMYRIKNAVSLHYWEHVEFGLVQTRQQASQLFLQNKQFSGYFSGLWHCISGQVVPNGAFFFIVKHFYKLHMILTYRSAAAHQAKWHYEVCNTPSTVK